MVIGLLYNPDHVIQAFGVSVFSLIKWEWVDGLNSLLQLLNFAFQLTTPDLQFYDQEYFTLTEKQ